MWLIATAVVAALFVIILLMTVRRRERVIDTAGPVVTSDRAATTTATSTIAEAQAQGGDQGPGDLLELQGKDDAECGLADWLMLEANTVLGIDLKEHPQAVARLAEAALMASAQLKSAGRATIDLPTLLVAGGGTRSYHRELTRAEAEPAMVEHGALLVDELIQWRGGDAATVALGEWLEGEADEDTSGETEGLDPPSIVRLADATEQAMADIVRTGRAVVDLRGLRRGNGDHQDFQREFDRAQLAEMIGQS